MKLFPRVREAQEHPRGFSWKTFGTPGYSRIFTIHFRWRDAWHFRVGFEFRKQI
jgi:hypothetical protein